MLWYIFFPILIFFYVTACYKKASTGIIVVFILLFFSVFRDSTVGTDTMNYMDNVESIVKVFVSKSTFFEDNGRYEYIYYLLCVLVYWFDLSPRFVITVFSVVTFLFLYLGSKKNNVNVALVCLFYVLSSMYFLSFNIARQFAALSICFYAVSFIKEQGLKRYRFFIWLFIGALIHKSVILCIPFYFCRFIEFDRKKAGMSVLLVYILFVLFPVTSLFLNLLSSLNLPLVENYGNAAIGAYEQPLLGILYKLISGSILFFIYLLRSPSKRTDLYDNYFLLYMLAVALMAEGNLYFFRLKFNYMIILCLYLSDFFYSIKNKKITLYWLYCLLTYCYAIKSIIEYSPYSLSFDSII